jgi:plastocyanin
MKSLSSVLLAALMLLTSPAFAADAPMKMASVKTAPNQIAINEYMFAPVTLNVIAGTKVTWINHDEIPHTVVDGSSNKLFRSSALDTNDSYSYTFTKPGTYHYFCTLHPQMVGTIHVAAAK